MPCSHTAHGTVRFRTLPQKSNIVLNSEDSCVLLAVVIAELYGSAQSPVDWGICGHLRTLCEYARAADLCVADTHCTVLCLNGSLGIGEAHTNRQTDAQTDRLEQRLMSSSDPCTEQTRQAFSGQLAFVQSKPALHVVYF